MTTFLACALILSLLTNAGLVLHLTTRRRPRDARPPKRTGGSGRGPARSHHWPAHPVPRPPLAADPDRTQVALPVITREITPSPLARWRHQ